MKKKPIENVASYARVVERERWYTVFCGEKKTQCFGNAARYGQMGQYFVRLNIVAMKTNFE